MHVEVDYVGNHSGATPSRVLVEKTEWHLLAIGVATWQFHRRYHFRCRGMQ